jgi:hypothetical protein
VCCIDDFASLVFIHSVETIMFKARPGTKAKLKRLGKMSDLLRAQVDKLLAGKSDDSAHVKARSLCGVLTGPSNASRSRDFLKQYAPKGNH